MRELDEANRSGISPDDVVDAFVDLRYRQIAGRRTPPRRGCSLGWGGPQILDVFHCQSGCSQTGERTSFSESLHAIAAIVELAQGLADNLDTFYSHQVGHRSPVLADYVHPFH